MSDVALFAGDRFYRSQFGTGQASYTIFQKDGVTYADPGYPGGTPYSGTVPRTVIQNTIAAIHANGGGLLELGPFDFTQAGIGGLTILDQNNIVIRGQRGK